MIELEIQCFVPGKKMGTIDKVYLDDSEWGIRSDVITNDGCVIGIKLIRNSLLEARAIAPNKDRSDVATESKK